MSLDLTLYDANGKELHWQNITHNLCQMAEEAELYKPLWCPAENGITCAGDLVEPLVNGLIIMVTEPERFRPLNPPNGWGSCDDFVLWLVRLLEACRKYPTALVDSDV